MTFELVYPMAAMVLLTAMVLIRTVLGRFAAVKRGDVDARFYKTFDGEGGEPRRAAQRSRHFVNLFENPVLFYAGCLTAMVTGQAAGPVLWFAWAFVVCRVAHAVVHMGSNSIPQRMVAYGASWIVLLAIWAFIVIGVARTA